MQTQKPTPASLPLWKKIVAFAVAGMADLFQVILFPFFLEGALSPLNDAVDFVVAIILTVLMGWHWVFLPSMVAKLVPGLDLAPTWTLAVTWVVLRRGTPPLPPKRGNDAGKT